MNFLGTSLTRDQHSALLDLYLNGVQPDPGTAAALRRRSLIVENDGSDHPAPKTKGSWKLAPFGKAVVAEIMRRVNLNSEHILRLGIIAHELTEMLAKTPGDSKWGLIVWSGGTFRAVEKNYIYAAKERLFAKTLDIGTRWEDAKEWVRTAKL